MRSPSRYPRHRTPGGTSLSIRFRLLTLVAAVVFAAACSSDDADSATDTSAEGDTPAENVTEEATVSSRDSGMTVTVQQTEAATLHTLTAPEEVFANSTHIIETENSLVLIDTQFLLPNALDMRAYADDLDKPIDRVFITHAHPDHFLGSEAFADLDVYALADVADEISANGEAEIAEKQADFGDAIASTFVTPEAVEPGTIEVDGVAFELAEVLDAEAHVQLVISVPDAGAVVTGDIVYSGVHLIMAGQPEPWTAALNDLKATSDQYPFVLPGHGVPGTPEVYDTNIEWLATAQEQIDTATDGAEFKAGMIAAFPDLGMEAAIDFVTPLLFPDDDTDADAAPAAAGEVAFGETVVNITAVGDGMAELVGSDPVVADAFGVIGLIPPSDGNSMTITATG